MRDTDDLPKEAPGASGSPQRVWPEPAQATSSLFPPAMITDEIPQWAAAPTVPYVPVVRSGPPEKQRAPTQPEWPLPDRPSASQRRADRQRDQGWGRQLSPGCGVLATLLLLSVAAMAAVTSGLPFFGGSAVPARGVQANPLPTATATPAATVTASPLPSPIPKTSSSPPLSPGRGHPKHHKHASSP